MKGGTEFVGGSVQAEAVQVFRRAVTWTYDAQVFRLLLPESNFTSGYWPRHARAAFTPPCKILRSILIHYSAQKALHPSHPILSTGHIAVAGIELQAYADMLELCNTGHRRMGCTERHLARYKENRTLPSVGHAWLRPGTQKKVKSEQ